MQAGMGNCCCFRDACFGGDDGSRRLCDHICARRTNASGSASILLKSIGDANAAAGVGKFYTIEFCSGAVMFAKKLVVTLCYTEIS